MLQPEVWRGSPCLQLPSYVALCALDSNTRGARRHERTSFAMSCQHRARRPAGEAAVGFRRAGALPCVRPPLTRAVAQVAVHFRTAAGDLAAISCDADLRVAVQEYFTRGWAYL